MKKEIYIFSGLGADERVFQYFDFSDCNAHFIKWIPAAENEYIDNYATRLLCQITHPKPILIGLSFGGIMAIEVAKQLEVEKLIIIASVKSRKEIPFLYRWAGRINMHKMLPSKMMRKSNVIVNFLFGASTSHEKQLLKQILLDTDPHFLEWAIDVIVKWKGANKGQIIKHIHGTKDRIFPLCFVDANITIEGGGHLMTLSHSEEIMEKLRED